ncbi:pyridoxamine 5'-phosphate oxidase family protein [Aquibacillus sediminis]|uniref:pyridoxamine 5'-phosphate oxidase family protein n=1 Tax=Aquibacillus sediminis TaxID=2574734 RepID=UPI001109C39D|nr:pyridoxamine 5'-phosphate oxidase family protein [Aquibacillus sediminis]
MQQTELKQKAKEMMDHNQLGTLATVKDGKPFSRYMTFFHDDLTLYTATNKQTHKVDDINKNDNVHILLGYEGEGLNDAYLEIEGKAAVYDSSEIKKRLWNDDLEPWFDGPEDPDYTVLHIDPSEIRIMNESDQPEILELN